MVRQLHLLLRALDLLPVLTRGRRLRSLAPDDREAFLARVQDAPILLVRRGLWGLRTLVFMGHYGRPEVQAAIGYGARLRGRREHPDAREPGGGDR